MEESSQLFIPIRFECIDCSAIEEFVLKFCNYSINKKDCENYEVSFIQKINDNKNEIILLIRCKNCGETKKEFFNDKKNEINFKCENCHELKGFIINYFFPDETKAEKVENNEIIINDNNKINEKQKLKQKPPKGNLIKIKFNNGKKRHNFNFAKTDTLNGKFFEIKNIFDEIDETTNFYFNSLIIDKNNSFEKNNIYDGCEIEIDS